MTPRPRLQCASLGSRSARLPEASNGARTVAWLSLAALGFALVWPDAASGAESGGGGLQILPTGFVENFAEHGFMALFHMRQFWLLVGLFAVLSVILNRFAFTPLLAVLDERERRMGGARERAATLSGETESLLARHEAALREARERAQTERQRVLEEARDGAQARVDAARGEAETQTQTARREVNDALATARSALREDSDQVAEAIADRLLGAPSA